MAGVCSPDPTSTFFLFLSWGPAPAFPSVATHGIPANARLLTPAFSSMGIALLGMLCKRWIRWYGTLNSVSKTENNHSLVPLNDKILKLLRKPGYLDLLLQVHHRQLVRREARPGKHTEMVWTPGRRKRILQPDPTFRNGILSPRENSINLGAWGRLSKRSTESISLTQWRRIISGIIERTERELSGAKNIQVLWALGSQGRLVRLAKKGE